MVVMKNSILFFLLLIPAFLFAQYPNTGNKARLGYQTTGDGLIWRGVAADTVLKPRVIAHAYFQLDTVNGVLRRYIATRGSWQVVGGGSSTDSTVYATRYWTSQNFFPLEGGTLTGTGGAGFIGFPSQVSAPGTPVSGLNVYAQGSSFNWKGTDGFERQFGGTLTGGRSYTLPDINGTLALGTGTADRSARWSGTNTLVAGNITDNGTKLEALKPWQFNSSSLVGLPTGVSRYIMDISDYDWFARYSSTAGAWISPAQTNTAGGKFTAGRFSRADANGRLQDGLLSESSNVVSIVSNNLFQFGKWVNTGARPTLGEAQVGYNQAKKAFEYSDGSTVYNLGFWVPSSSDIYFLQNVGIGTSTMTAKLNLSATGGTNSLLRILSTSASSVATTDWYNSSSDLMQAYVAGSSFSSGAFTARSAGVSYSGTGGYNIITYGSGAPIRFVTGGVATTNERLNISSVGTITQLNTTTGLFLASGTTGQTPSEAGGLIRFNLDSTLYQIYSSGVRSYVATRAYVRSVFSGVTWLKTELQAGRDVDITGGTSTDFRLRSNTRTQFDGIFKVGADSIMRVKGAGLVKNPGSSIFSSAFFGGGALELRQQVSSFQPIFTMELDSNRNRSFITFRKYNGNSVNILAASDGVSETGALVIQAQIRNDTSSTCGISFDMSKIDAFNSVSQPMNADFVRFNAYTTTHKTGQQANGNWYWGADKNTVISPSGDSIFHNGKLRLQGLGTGTATTILGKTSTNEIIPVSISSFGNGIYGGSGTLSDNTTVDADGHSLDVENLTELNFYSEGGNGSLGFTDEVFRVESDTMVNLSTTSGGEIEIKEGVRMVGKVQAKQEAYYEITSTSSPQTFSSDISDNYVNQGSTQASFTFLFPATPADGQILMITWGNAISVVTLDGNGNTITGTAVTTAVAGTRRMFKYYDSSGEWVKIY